MDFNYISKTKLSRLATLKTRKGRIKEGLFMAQGKKIVSDTLPYFELDTLLTLSGDIPFLSIPREKILLATESDFKKISTLSDLPDVIAVYKKPENDGHLKISDRNSYYLVLDGVSDPGNFGTIIRTAHWFGIKKIFCGAECPDLYNPKVVQSTMGSIAKIEVSYGDIRKLLEQNRDIPVYGLLLEGENIFSQGGFNPGFIVMGNEGHGIGKNILPLITNPLTIPPADPLDHPESLNVAIATAITLSQMIS